MGQVGQEGGTVTLREAGALIARRARLEIEPGSAEAIGTAWCQGRLDPQLADRAGVATGQRQCMVCGMVHWTPLEAVACCTPDGWLPDKPTPLELARLADMSDLVRPRDRAAVSGASPDGRKDPVLTG